MLLTEPKPTMGFFALCEGQNGMSQAWALQDRIQELCGGQFELNAAFWNFALLRQPALREHARAEATGAQMIVLSLAQTEWIPEEIILWLENLPVRQSNEHGALVVLLPKALDLASASAGLAEQQLSKIAADRGLDFFCNEIQPKSTFKKTAAADFLFRRRSACSPPFSHSRISWDCN